MAGREPARGIGAAGDGPTPPCGRDRAEGPGGKITLEVKNLENNFEDEMGSAFIEEAKVKTEGPEGVAEGSFEGVEVHADFASGEVTVWIEEIDVKILGPGGETILDEEGEYHNDFHLPFGP